MREIAGLEAAEALLGKLQPHAFRNVAGLTYHVAEESDDKHGNVDLLMESPESGDRIHWRFENVKNLRIDSFGGGIPQVVGFFVKNVSDRGWERINWEVGDFEHGVLTFMAQSVRIVAVSKAGSGWNLLP